MNTLLLVAMTTSAILSGTQAISCFVCEAMSHVKKTGIDPPDPCAELTDNPTMECPPEYDLCTMTRKISKGYKRGYIQDLMIKNCASSSDLPDWEEVGCGARKCTCNTDNCNIVSYD